MQTELTQSLIKDKLKKRHKFIDVYPLNDYPTQDPYEYTFYSMNGKVTMYLYTNSTQRVYSKLYKWSGSSWYVVIDHEIDEEIIHSQVGKTWHHNISQGYYKWRAYTKGTMWSSERQKLWIYKTHEEHQIKGNKIRLVNDSFTGYLPAARTNEITISKLNNGQVCTY